MKFTIHDLLWLTLVIASPLGQWVWFRADMKDRIGRGDTQGEAETENTQRTTNPVHPARESP